MHDFIGAGVHYRPDMRTAGVYRHGVVTALSKTTVTIRDCETGETVKRPAIDVYMACQPRYMTDEWGTR